MSACVLSALAHPDQTQADARFLLPAGLLRTKPRLVVADLQLNARAVIAGLNVDPARRGVTHRVTDGFLHDPECGDQDVGRKVDRKSVRLHRDLTARMPRLLACKPLQG